MPERAIDVYEPYQGSIDWRKVASADVRHVLIKLSNGSSAASTTGDRYVIGARAAGLRVGGYAYALGGKPESEADALADELLRLNALDDAPALDYESDRLPYDEPSARQWIVAFFSRLSRRIPALTQVLLYSSGSQLTRINAGTITMPGLRILIWDAEYGPNDGIDHDVRYYHGPVAVHQYTSAGRIAGIDRNVDLDVVFTDISAQTKPRATKGIDLMERYHAKAIPSDGSVHILLPGGDQSAVIVRPGSQPVWLSAIYAWGDNNVGVGGNPVSPGAVMKIDKTRKFILTGALYADFAYSSNSDFIIDAVG
ncbi:glycoside hydrolase family 25 protein [Amycolatopsis sp. cmx-11-12]|uniref:glycoside hydrolase family 25 protein n=1 Tax=Amycolatopsis sp. cmx-11-12 TaxID=2785795 RepID=UPI003917EFD6